MIARLSRVTLATVLAGFILSTAALAQTEQTAQDPARLAAAKELMVAMNIQEQFHKTTGAMKDLLTQQMASQPGGDKMKSILDKIFDPNGADIKTYFTDAELAYTNFFAQHFTVEELKAIAAFQGSDVGKKMQASMPDMIAALGPPLAKFQEGVKKQLLEELQTKPQP